MFALDHDCDGVKTPSFRSPAWTPERIALLRQLHAEGVRFEAIAAQLGGGITKNAAIGQARRLGLDLRISGWAVSNRTRRAGGGSTRPPSPPPFRWPRQGNLRELAEKLYAMRQEGGRL